mmetsp:Transcript_16272/g.18100  ORF Transcript_16272/g.18100 Transcript_16272/m.18100 type:complete len:102 (+) Transcript_16272:3-308(+)
MTEPATTKAAEALKTAAKDVSHEPLKYIRTMKGDAPILPTIETWHHRFWNRIGPYRTGYMWIALSITTAVMMRYSYKWKNYVHHRVHGHSEHGHDEHAMIY